MEIMKKMPYVLYYVWLAESFPYGSMKPMQIVKRYGNNLHLFYENLEKEAKEFNVTENRLRKLKSKKLEDCYQVLENCENLNVKIVDCSCDSFPERLRNFDSAPVVLYYIGNLEVLKNPCVALVGTRKATTYGLKVAKKLAKDLASYGITVVSGCAEGIDSNAHFGTLEENGKTAAVLGTSLEKSYPEGSGKLKREIVKSGGIILSEYAPKTESAAWLFPVRNRIIVGLSDSVIVAQSPEKSGAMITANIACNSGKDLFCVPPSNIYDKRNAGVIKCLKEGAKLLLDVDDVLETYKFTDYVVAKQKPPKSSITERTVPKNLRPVFEAIGANESLDNISEKLKIPARKLLPLLTELEIFGFIKKFGLSYRKC